MPLSVSERQRYQKHLSLSSIGETGQLRLKNAKILVVGAGGLGCPVLLYLTAAGIGQLGVIDPDVVEISNLQRQVLYRTQDIGQPKAKVAVESLQKNNPEISFQFYVKALVRDNALDILKNYDLVIDCTDNFTVRYVINDACVMLNIPFVYGAIHQFEGQVSVFNYQNGPSYRCIFPEKPTDFEIPNCATVGVMGILPGIIGSLQANEAIKIITQIGQVLSGQLLMMDLLENTQRKIRFKRNEEAIALAHGSWNVEKVKNENKMNTISVEQLKQLVDNKADMVLLDVREEYEYELCALPNALLIPMNSIPENLEKIPKNKPVLVYCHHGMRSASVINYLETKAGFDNLSNLTGGIHAWAVAIDAEMARY